MTSDSPGPVATPPAPSTAVSPARTGAGRVLAYRWLLLIAICVLLLDRLTKVWICIHLPYPTYGPPGHIIVIEGLFNLVNVGNTGAAWSLFSGRSTALAILAVATLIAIYAWRRQLGLRVWIVQISFGTLCGGILGNLFDRLLYGPLRLASVLRGNGARYRAGLSMSKLHIRSKSLFENAFKLCRDEQA